MIYLPSAETSCTYCTFVLKEYVFSMSCNMFFHIMYLNNIKKLQNWQNGTSLKNKVMASQILSKLQTFVKWGADDSDERAVKCLCRPDCGSTRFINFTRHQIKSSQICSMTKDVFLCANKSKLTCGDKRECEQFFRRENIPWLASPKMATHSNTKYIELEESNLP